MRRLHPLHVIETAPRARAERRAWTLFLVTLLLALCAAGAWLDDDAYLSDAPAGELAAYADGLAAGTGRRDDELDAVSRAAFALGVEHGRQIGCAPAVTPLAQLGTAPGSAR